MTATIPLPNVIEPLEYETLLSQRKAAFIALFPEAEQLTWQDTLALESSPVTKLLETIAYLELILRARINAAAQANLLAFATDTDLDRLADFYGIARFSDENDDSFRRRIILRIQGSSTAGPAAHYRYHAFSAHPDVIDVHIASPNPGRVVIAVLSKKDPDSVLAAVKKVVLSDSVRVLTDTVTVIAAKLKPIDIHAVIKLGRDAPVQMPTLLRQQVEQIFASASLGMPISRSAIIAKLHQAGVVSVELLSPAYDVAIANDEVATLGNIALEIA